MPYTVRGHCVYKKDTGKKVGCTKGDVKKYLAALHMHAECTKYDIVCTAIVLNESVEEHGPMTPEERSKRRRMIKRMATLGVLTGAGISAAELMTHGKARQSLIAAAKQKGLGNKVKGLSKQLWKPMATGAALDLAVEPINTTIAQKMEDRYQRRKDQEK